MHQAAADLRQTARHWPHLRHMLTIPATTGGLGQGLRAYLAAERDDDQTAEDRAEHAERTAIAPGERPAPLRPSVLDTIRHVEQLLLATADQVARWQPPDLTDAERWHYAASWRHGAPWACTYLAATLTWLPPIPRQQVQQAARTARRQVEQQLGLAERTEPIPGRRCPRCRGAELVMRHGGERDPEVSCRTCPGRWVAGAMAVLLRDSAAA